MPYTETKKKPLRGRKNQPDNSEIYQHVQSLGNQLTELYKQYDYLTDPTLIDGCIYEMKSVQMKYKYYIELCREMEGYYDKQYDYDYEYDEYGSCEY